MRRQDALTCKPTSIWQKALAWTVSLAMVLMFVPAVAIPAPAWGEGDANESGVMYLGADGVKQTCENYVEVKSSTANPTVWDDSRTWYVARGDVTINGRVAANNTVNLILTDGCNLVVQDTMVVKKHNLAIYAQSNDENSMGKLTVTAAKGSSRAGIGSNDTDTASGTITINGGKITATATGTGGAAGIGAGKKTSCGDIVINGGIIEANGASSGAGIGAGRYGPCAISSLAAEL